MITADKLSLLTSMPTFMLEMTLPQKNRPSLQTARFLGLSNGNEFVYSVVDTAGAQGKVFLHYDPAVDQITGTLS